MKYYDLSYRLQEGVYEDGKEVNIGELISDSYKKCVKSNIIDVLEYKEIDFGKVSHDYQKNPQKWIQTIRIIIYGITGKVIDNYDIENIRLFYFLYRKHLKRNSPELLNLFDSNEFIFGLLPYIHIGFLLRNKGCNGVNNFNDFNNAFAFLDNLIKSNRFSTSSLLCAHRENNDIKKDSLVDKIDEIGIRKSINLVLGILKNIDNQKQGEIKFYQPDATVYGINSVFPGIFLNYAFSGRLLELWETMESHFSETSKILSSFDDGHILIKFDNIDQRLIRTEQYLNHMYGDKWYRISESNLSTLARDCDIANIAYSHTLPDVNRLMPFYQNSQAQLKDLSKLGIYDHNESLKSSIERFLNAMSSGGKALFETAFYLIWGIETSELRNVAIGFDRDHDKYQTEAFTLGYNLTNLDITPPPLLYARRNIPEKVRGNLRDNSFRQFWRISEY